MYLGSFTIDILMEVDLFRWLRRNLRKRSPELYDHIYMEGGGSKFKKRDVTI